MKDIFKEALAITEEAVAAQIERLGESMTPRELLEQIERIEAHKADLHRTGVLKALLNENLPLIKEVLRDAERHKELLAAAIYVRDDMKLRASIGTFDGDHDVQMGSGAWVRLNAAIDKAMEPTKGERG